MLPNPLRLPRRSIFYITCNVSDDFHAAIAKSSFFLFRRIILNYIVIARTFTPCAWNICARNNAKIVTFVARIRRAREIYSLRVDVYSQISTVSSDPWRLDSGSGYDVARRGLADWSDNCDPIDRQHGSGRRSHNRGCRDVTDTRPLIELVPTTLCDERARSGLERAFSVPAFGITFSPQGGGMSGIFENNLQRSFNRSTTFEETKEVVTLRRIL